MPRQKFQRRLTPEERREKLQINKGYADSQLAKANAKGSMEIKDSKLPKTNVTALKRLITEMLLNKGFEPTFEMIAALCTKFEYCPLCDIKLHDIITEYYKVEQLQKYLTNVTQITV